MLKLQAEPTFWADVPISIPGNGVPEIVRFEFRWLEQGELQDYLTRSIDRNDAESLAEIIADWKGIDSEYSTQNLSALLSKYQTSGASIFKVFRKELLTAKEKN